MQGDLQLEGPQKVGADPGSAPVRAAVSADLPGIARLQERSILRLGLQTYGRRRAEAWARVGVRYTDGLLGEGCFFVAERAGVLLGVGGWSPSVERNDEAWLRYVFIHPDAAGCGLGRRLVATAEQSAMSDGRVRLRLWSSLNALGFYRRLGYRSFRRATWAVEPGIELTYVLMGRRLPATEPLHAHGNRRRYASR